MNKSEDMFIQTFFIVQLFKNEKLFIQKDFQNFIKAIEGITKLKKKQKLDVIRLALQHLLKCTTNILS